MFNDGVDTYIYNQATGEIYVRYQRGQANYKDYFVKMPVGILPSQLEDSKDSKDGVLEMAKPQSQSSSSAKSTKELQQQAQELQKKMMETIIGE